MGFDVVKEAAKRCDVHEDVVRWWVRDKDLTDVSEENIVEFVKKIRIEYVDKQIADLIRARAVLDKQLKKAYEKKERLESL